MKTKFTTAVAHDDYVYGLDDGIMQCIDVKTGQQKWKGGRYGHGQILLVDDLIIVQTEPGPVVLIEASPEKARRAGQSRRPLQQDLELPQPWRASICSVRNDPEAVCYEVELAK